MRLADRFGTSLSCRNVTPSQASECQAPSYSLDSITDANLILVGIMTAQRFLETRAVAVHDIWGPSIPGKVRIAGLTCLTKLLVKYSQLTREKCIHLNIPLLCFEAAIGR
jgi:hypothetical protein